MGTGKEAKEMTTIQLGKTALLVNRNGENRIIVNPQIDDDDVPDVLIFPEEIDDEGMLFAYRMSDNCVIITGDDECTSDDTGPVSVMIPQSAIDFAMSSLSS